VQLRPPSTPHFERLDLGSEVTPPVRLLDFGAFDPFLSTIGRPRTLAWPVQVHRVTLPITSTAGHGYLNPFERVILKIIDVVGDLDEDQLAAETCIPVDLVRSVICRLQDRGLVDSANAIVDARRKIWEPDAPEEVDYQSALAFRELVGGRLIPFLQVLDDRTPIRTEDVDRRAWTLPRGHLGRLEPPSTGDVIRILGQMKRRSAVHDTSMRLPVTSQIRVMPEPEDYFLSCAIAIQAHDADFRIADPFGTGYAQVLEEVFDSRLDTDEKLQGWMSRWRISLESSTRADVQRARDRFDTVPNRNHYPKLIRALTPAAGAQHRTVEDIYAALEWALFYCCETHGPEVALRRLELDADSDYSMRMSDLASELGFERPGQGFRPVPKGKLDDYLRGMPELETVLAIALLQAELDSDHPMRSLASAHPEFIVRVRTLASDRGERAHGQRAAPMSDVELASEPFMRDSISTLLPAIQFDSIAATSETPSRADLRLEARNKLLQSFGHRRFKKLGPSAQGSLQSAEMFLLASSDGDDARSFVSDLYSALQAVLRNFLGDVAPVDIPTWEYTKQAARNAHDAGLGALPESLTSVNPRRIEDALQGNDRSLGASVMSFLLTAGPETLKEVQFQKPDFLEFLARIPSMRGHANQPVLMQRQDMRTLSRSTVTTVGMLLDLIRED
jgi:hypothetical protein